MGFVQKMKHSYQAMKIGAAIMGEGIGWKAGGGSGGGGGILSAIAQLLSPKYGEPPAKGTENWLELFGKSPRLDPAHKIAEDVASAEWALYKVDKKGEYEEIDEHPLKLLFKRPNPETTWYNLLYMTEAYLLLRGEAFWILEANGLGAPSEVWICPPHWVQETPTIAKPFFIVQTQDGGRMEVPKEHMVYFKEPNLANPYGRGQGRAQGIEDEIETDEYMAKWSKRFFFNDAKPPFLITAPGANQTEAKRFEESWMEKYGGMNNAHKPGVLPWEAKIIELAKSQKDMDFVESRKFLRDLTNQHFRVPPELMGIIENSNRATIDAADYIYRSSVLINRLRMIQDTINMQLSYRYGEDLCFEFINVIPEDKEFNLKLANEGISRGTMKLDEWRTTNNQDPLEGGVGDILYVPAGVTPSVDPLADKEQARADAEQARQDALNSQKPDEEEEDDGGGDDDGGGNEPPEEEPAAEEDDSAKWFQQGTKSLTRDGRKALWKRFDKAASKHEKAAQKALQKYFDKQGQKALENLKQMEKSFTDLKTKDTLDEQDVNHIVNQLLKWGTEGTRLAAIISTYWMESAKEGWSAANGVYQLGISFDLIREEMLEWIENEGADLVTNITETTKEGLRSTITKGIEEGEGIPEIASRVSNVFEVAATSRSFTIARTETHNSMARGSFLTYKAANVEKKEWIATQDSRTRSKHSKMDGEIVGMDEEFSNGLMHPGDSKGRTDEVINCRCALAPVIEDGEE